MISQKQKPTGPNRQVATKLFIDSSRGIVHKLQGNGTTCDYANVRRKHVVTVIQCRVFKLPCCSHCFPDASEYKHLIQT